MENAQGSNEVKESAFEVKVPVPVPANELHESYYEVKVEGGHFAPFVPPVATEQQKTVEDLKQVVADLTALVQQLASSRPA